MKAFNDGIKEIIEKFAYDFFIVQQDFQVKCTCINATTKQPDAKCPKCLGLGHKIKIKKIRGASQDAKGTFRNQAINESSMTATYYIDGKYPIYEENVIVDEDEVYIVYRLERKRSANKEIVYYQSYAVGKKSNVNIFLENFYRIVGGGSDR